MRLLARSLRHSDTHTSEFHRCAMGGAYTLNGRGGQPSGIRPISLVVLHAQRGRADNPPCRALATLRHRAIHSHGTFSTSLARVRKVRVLYRLASPMPLDGARGGGEGVWGPVERGKKARGDIWSLGRRCERRGREGCNATAATLKLRSFQNVKPSLSLGIALHLKVHRNAIRPRDGIQTRKDFCIDVAVPQPDFKAIIV